MFAIQAILLLLTLWVLKILGKKWLVASRIRDTLRCAVCIIHSVLGVTTHSCQVSLSRSSYLVDKSFQDARNCYRAIFPYAGQGGVLLWQILRYVAEPVEMNVDVSFFP